MNYYCLALVNRSNREHDVTIVILGKYASNKIKYLDQENSSNLKYNFNTEFPPYVYQNTANVRIRR